MESLYDSAGRVPPEDLEEVTTCELCGGSSSVHQLDVPPWTLRRCTTCGIVFTSPRLNERALERHYKQGYYEGSTTYFSQQVSPITADQRDLAREVASRLRGRGGHSLDVGCGAGQLVQAFAEAGFDAVGTEPSEAACRSAVELGRRVTDAELSSFPDASFDCVTVMHVLEHVSHPRGFLAEIGRVTRPGGIVVVEVPNYGCRTARVHGASWIPLYPDTHLFHYTPETLRFALRNAGIEAVHTRRLGGLGLLAGQRGHAAPGSKSTTAAPSRPQGGSTVKGAVRAIRTRLLDLPGVRRTVRWVAWELLGNGEYVRVIGRKLPA